jgi:ribose 5-phosphate isomerase A
MNSEMSDRQRINLAKRQAAERAATLVQDGMLLGLGSGTTSELFVRALGERVAAGLRLRGVASSARTERVAQEMGITLVDLTEPLDLAVDGAVAVEVGTLAAIKGHGGALTREKLVAGAAARFVLIVDPRKVFQHMRDASGTVPLPVEVLPFGWQMTCKRLAQFGDPVLRERDGQPFVTDNGNFILDIHSALLDDPVSTAHRISATLGVVDHGLFLDMASLTIVGCDDGVQELTGKR